MITESVCGDLQIKLNKDKDMEWFGWLTKPHYLVTGIDQMIGGAEFIAALIIGFALFLWLVNR